MTREDFFTLTEMKDGLTVPARVEELVSVMKKETDSLVKNIVDSTRQWAAVASTIAATVNKECLDLFVQLDGLLFIDRWLKDAQTFPVEGNTCFVEEAISSLLLAVEKLQMNNDRLLSSGICITVQSLLTYKSARVQDRAKALFDNWKAKDVGLLSVGVEKAPVYGDLTENNEHPESLSAAADVLPMRSPDDPNLESEDGMNKMSNDQAQRSLDDADFEDRGPDTGTSAVKVECVEGDNSVKEEVCLSDWKLDPHCPSGSTEVKVEPTSEFLKLEQVTEDARDDNEIISGQDRPVKAEVSSDCIRDKNDFMAAEEVPAKPDHDTNDAKDDLSVKNAFSKDTNQPLGEPRDGLNDSGGLERTGFAPGEGLYVLGETKDLGTTTSGMEEVDRYSEAKRHHKSNRKCFGNTYEFSKLTKTSKNTDFVRQADMDLEDGTVDALEVARLVANEVEREVVGYDENSDNSSSADEIISRGSIRQPDSPESINGGQDQHLQTDPPVNELPTMENVSLEASGKEHLIDSVNQDTKLENPVHDMESSQVTVVLRETEVDTEKSLCAFDLNQEFSSENLDHQVDTISNPVSVVFTSRVVMAPGIPAGAIQFEGTLGWKGSAASPGRASDSEKAFSGGGTSSCSRQRQDFLGIDLNMAECGDDNSFLPVSGKQNQTLPGVPSGESSVELSPKRSEWFKFDLNQIDEDGDVPVSEWKLGGRILRPQNCRRSPSPSSSSSCLQPSARTFDLNDNPPNCDDDSVISILGAKVKRSTVPPQTTVPFPIGRATQPVMDASLLRGGALVGLGPAVPYVQPVYGYNGLAMAPVTSFPPGPTYGPGGPFSCLFDSRGTPVMPQIVGSPSTVSSSYNQSPLVMSMMGSSPGSNYSGALRPNLDLNSGYAIERGNRDPAFFRQLLVPGQGRPLEEQLRDNFRPFSSGASGGKRKEPDSGWELYPTNYKHHQPPYL